LLPILNPAGFSAAAQEIRGWPGYRLTNLVPLPGLAASLGLGGIWYKDEGSRFGLGSFKALGGAYAVYRLLAAAVKRATGREPSSAELMGGADAILDAEEGRLIQDPVRHTRDIFDRRMTTRSVTTAAEAEFLPRPAVTRGGTRIAVAINVDEPSIVDNIDPAHCDGIGLTRTEFMF